MKRRVTRDSVYDEIRGFIVEWELDPGERLSEEGLAERLSVSRTPVREALHRLEAEGLVVRNSNGSLSVAEASPHAARSVFKVRTSLERVAAREAAQRATEEEIEAMDRALAAMEVAVRLGDLRLVGTYGREFHALVHRACRNRICIAFLEQLQPHVDRYRMLTTGYDEQRSTHALEQHRSLLEAIKNGDQDLAEELAGTHTTTGEEIAIRAIEAHRDSGDFLGSEAASSM